MFERRIKIKSKTKPKKTTKEPVESSEEEPIDAATGGKKPKKEAKKPKIKTIIKDGKKIQVIEQPSEDEIDQFNERTRTNDIFTIETRGKENGKRRKILSIKYPGRLSASPFLIWRTTCYLHESPAGQVSR